MRPSVAQRAERSSIRKRRVYLALFLLLAVALCGLFLSYANWRANAEAHDQATALTKLDQQIADAMEVRIEKAKKLEAAAKLDSTAYEAAQAKKPVSTATASSANCDVASPTSIRIVVNKKHCINPINWEPDDLVEISSRYMRTEAANHMATMMQAAKDAGQVFFISSAYRSYADQVATYASWVDVNGSEAAADAVSARPGYSEHQTGLAADLETSGCVLECFGTTSQYAWLKAHAAEYGFIQRYPSGLMSITGYETETWHWRYVGVTTAKDMAKKGIETLEAYLNITGGDYK